ncbi:helix-turn-helix transcriptional regulator [Brevibacterium sp. RIT 803]|uniref:helix-turn-helix transcriptional regulator n=1 Tax=Brevibacterium sp. RIT 803 TaxID=2810210 RepID=UPI00339067F2
MGRNESGTLSSWELGRFLKSRRDQLRPLDVGLPSGTRRRVTGLRREEVTVLAHVGTTWYTWLEQGRDIHPSEEVLVSIAEALRLAPEERAHLFRLGGYRGRAESPETGAIDDRLQTMLETVMPFPAMVHDVVYQWQSYNSTYRYLVGDADEITDGSCIVQLLENPEWKHAFRDDPNELRLLTAKLRTSFAEFPDDPRWPNLLERLRRHTDFSRHWDSGNVVRESSTSKVIDNPWVGRLDLISVGFVVQEDRRLTLSVHQPTNPASKDRLEQLQRLIDSDEVTAASRYA